MIFQCTRCQKYFNNKTHYNKHLARKLQCKENNNKILDHDCKNIFEEESNTTLNTSNVVSGTTSSSIKLACHPIENNIFINSKENGYKCVIYNTLPTKIGSFSLLLG